MEHEQKFLSSTNRNRQTLFVAALAVGLACSASAPAQVNSGYQPVAMKLLKVLPLSIPLGEANRSQVLHVNICLHVPEPAALDSFVTQVSNPLSSNYRHFLTPQQFGSMFGQPHYVVQNIVSYLQSNGFTIKLVAANNLNIMADCTVAQAETAFKTTIDKFHAFDPHTPGNQDYVAYVSVPQMPTQYAPYVLDISGLETYTKPEPVLGHVTLLSHVNLAHARQGIQTLDPNQTRVLYNLAPTYNAGYQGQGRTMAISNWDGFSLSNVPLWYSQYALPTPAGGVGSNVSVVTIDGGSMNNPPVGEGDLDFQMVLGEAPLCNLIIYDGAGPLADTLTKEANDNVADEISESWIWGLSQSDAEACHVLHAQMAAQGITYMHAPGDYGTSIEPYYYADNDPDVLNVGGTVATVDSQGNRQSEVGWSGSGGGWVTEPDSFNVLPSWQHGLGVPTSINFRLLPDVALHAAGNGGAYYFFTQGTLATADGTSFATPVFTGGLGVCEERLIALGELPVDPNGKYRLGRVNDLVYSQNGRADVWHDITSGSNGTLPDGSTSNAGPFWDFVTGWGAIDFTAFISTFRPVHPPTNYAPGSVSVMTGTYAAGSLASFTRIDGNDYEVNTADISIGPTSAEVLGYTLDTGAGGFSSLGFSVTANAPSLATIQVFAYNWTTSTYDLIKSFAGTGAQNTTTASISNWSSYENGSNQVTLVVRAYVPERFHAPDFRFDVDQAILVGQKS